MKKIALIWMFVCASFVVMAQDSGRADALFQQGDYSAAFRQYTLLHRDYPGTVLYTYRLGRCEQELGLNEEAVQHLTEAGDRYSMRPYWLAMAAYSTYRFDLAKEMFATFLENNAPDESHYESAEEGLRKAEQGARFFHRVENIAFLDTVSFPIDSLAAHLPTLSADMGSFGYTDGHFVCTNERGDRRYFSFTDKASGRKLIGRQERLLDEWTAVDTLPSSVNQFAEQDFPLLMPDGMTLYFAARSDQGFGGWDIYVTRYNAATDSYLVPEPLGLPFNSFADDALYLFDEAQQKGYFLSNRASAEGIFTLYSFVPQEPRYLRDTTESYLRDFVQLRVLPKAERRIVAERNEMDLTSPVLTELAKAEPDWTLVINDSTIYTSLDDFSNPQARAKMQEYLDLQDQILEESADLSARRLAYKNAETAVEKQALKPLILSVENDVRRLRQESHALRMEVVRLERQ